MLKLSNVNPSYCILSLSKDQFRRSYTFAISKAKSIK